MVPAQSLSENPALPFLLVVVLVLVLVLDFAPGSRTTTTTRTRRLFRCRTFQTGSKATTFVLPSAITNQTRLGRFLLRVSGEQTDRNLAFVAPRLLTLRG
jgi:hypothetical protein